MLISTFIIYFRGYICNVLRGACLLIPCYAGLGINEGAVRSVPEGTHRAGSRTVKLHTVGASDKHICRRAGPPAPPK